MNDKPDTELTGNPDGKPHREINPETGQQRAYVVLSEVERAKGFLEPLRLSYVHVGIPEPGELRDLTDEEKERFSEFGYVKFEAYDDVEGVTGKYWTQEQLDRIGQGCNTVTRMSAAIAETYARQPRFYGGTFCSHCKAHFPVGPKGEFVWDGTEQRVGTRSQQPETD